LQSRNFWLLVHALQQYISLPESEGLLPISATLPDMKASTKDYVHLQGLYKDKANEDLRAFVECVKKTLQSVGLDEDAIEQEEISNFVKNCHWLLCIDGRSLRDEAETDIQKTLIC
jgi:amyloid beta precursor protein binding protein 1